MARLTINAVNVALKAAGAAEELVKGDGYFYFDSGSAHKWYATIVYVYRINDLTLDQWVESWRSLRNDYLKTLEF